MIVLLSSLLQLSEFYEYRFLNMIYSLFFFFLFLMAITLGIQPATSLLFIISHPACDAIVTKYSSTST